MAFSLSFVISSMNRGCSQMWLFVLQSCTLLLLHYMLCAVGTPFENFFPLNYSVICLVWRHRSSGDDHHRENNIFLVTAVTIGMC